ncbi:uncharacterized protein MELLADRAFT_113922 [Melampsora larici-populina 98AG31]|uniref:Uncharacterized protein n=1 Tax=Melampsora larici-populina (strain 98AG31 / pathotype 3-4-7) TaxID=747676 RepID=F4SBI3_MELLP|nr:uncharacterized protein MELLADRAFT_113922 [Melampsora larici-populina 98AG31]EGF97994.1 hypothetical protein MELLADRAFT_113922 [Melampsora larici-populina 98AG31]
MPTQSGKRLRSPAAPATEARSNHKTSAQNHPNSSNRVPKRARGVRLNLKQPESLLLPEELALRFRDCNDALKKNWLSDIQNGHFTIEKIPASEMITLKRKTKNKSSKKHKSKSTQPHAASPVTTQDHTRNQGTSDQVESQSISQTQTLSDQSQSQNGESLKKNKSKKSKKPAKKSRRDDDESSEYETAS